MSKTIKNGERLEKFERSPKNPLLDTKGKIVRQNDEKEPNRLIIWKMRNIASGILTFEEDTRIQQIKKLKEADGLMRERLGRWKMVNYPAICLCGRYHHRKQQKNVLVAKGDVTGKAFYANLVSCGSVWRCPVCSYKITKVRQIEVFKLLNFYMQENYQLSFLTLTIRHKRGDALKTLLTRLLEEFRKFQRVRKYREFAESYIGMVKATEITYNTTHGWHPHLHIVFVHKKGVSRKEVDLLMEKIIPAWCDRKNVNGAAGAQCYMPVSSNKDLSDYITKWDSSKEITGGSFKLTQKEKKAKKTKQSKSYVKRNTGGSTTPFGMLFKVATGEIKRNDISSLYEAYVRATKGKNQLIISQGLRAKYKELNSETKEDMEIVKDERIANLLLSIAPELWKEILSKNAAPLLLSAYDNGGFEAFKKELFTQGIEYDEDKTDTGLPYLF